MWPFFLHADTQTARSARPLKAMLHVSVDAPLQGFKEKTNVWMGGWVRGSDMFTGSCFGFPAKSAGSSCSSVWRTPYPRGGWVEGWVRERHFSLNLGRTDRPNPPTPPGVGAGGGFLPGLWVIEILVMCNRDATKPSTHGARGAGWSGDEDARVEMDVSSSSSDPHSS